jgi:nucleoside-diphosphate-sugar epimerase
MPPADPSSTLVTVTGASGFIAVHCVRELLERAFRPEMVLDTAQAMNRKS